MSSQCLYFSGKGLTQASAKWGALTQIGVHGDRDDSQGFHESVTNNESRIYAFYGKYAVTNNYLND